MYIVDAKIYSGVLDDSGVSKAYNDAVKALSK